MKKFNCVLILFFINFFSYGQEIGAKTNSENDIHKNIFGGNIEISFGLSSSNYRDFATSPLIYKGTPLYYALNYSEEEDNYEFKCGFSILKGYFSEKYYNESKKQSNVNIKNFNISYLVKLNSIKSKKVKLLFGGDIKVSLNERNNETLQNNQWGTELIPTLFALSKLVVDLSRKKNKYVKFLFFNYILNPRKRDFSLKLNIGIINSSYRNHFIYTDPVNTTHNNYKEWDKYVFKIFSGFRIGTELDYRIYLNNKNSIRFSYLWDAYKTGGNLDKLEMAHHILNVSLLYKIY